MICNNDCKNCRYGMTGYICNTQIMGCSHECYKCNYKNERFVVYSCRKPSKKLRVKDENRNFRR